MKKITLSIVLLSIMGMFYFSACTKVDIEKVEKEMTTTLIKGFAYANLDFTNDTNEFGGAEIQYEAVPAGTLLFAKLNSEDLDPNPNGQMEYQTLSFDATVGSDGSFEFKVYAGVDNINVTITAEDFEYNQVIDEDTTEKRYFVLPQSVVTVSQGSVDFIDLLFLVN